MLNFPLGEWGGIGGSPFRVVALNSHDRHWQQVASLELGGPCTCHALAGAFYSRTRWAGRLLDRLTSFVSFVSFPNRT